MYMLPGLQQLTDNELCFTLPQFFVQHVHSVCSLNPVTL